MFGEKAHHFPLGCLLLEPRECRHDSCDVRLRLLLRRFLAVVGYLLTPRKRLAELAGVWKLGLRKALTSKKILEG